MTHRCIYIIQQLNNESDFIMTKSKSQFVKQRKSSKQATCFCDLTKLQCHAVSRRHTIRHFVDLIELYHMQHGAKNEQ